MIIRKDFQSMPPKPYLMQIMDEISKTYVLLWEKMDEKNKVNMTWDEVRYIQNKNTFRTCLRKLNNIGLLSYIDTSSDVTIELVAWDDFENDC